MPRRRRFSWRTRRAIRDAVMVVVATAVGFLMLVVIAGPAPHA